MEGADWPSTSGELRIADETHFVACDESEPFVQARPRFRSQNFKAVIRNVAHVLKHSRPMPCDNTSILSRGATNSKRVGHQNQGSMPNPPSQGYGAAGVQRRNQNLLGVTAL